MIEHVIDIGKLFVDIAKGNVPSREITLIVCMLIISFVWKFVSMLKNEDTANMAWSLCKNLLESLLIIVFFMSGFVFLGKIAHAIFPSFFTYNHVTELRLPALVTLAVTLISYPIVQLTSKHVSGHLLESTLFILQCILNGGMVWFVFSLWVTEISWALPVFVVLGIIMTIFQCIIHELDQQDKEK